MREWAFAVSFVAMLLIGGSYFHKKKSLYLAFQAMGIVFLMASYLLTKEYFAMVGLGIGLARVLTYFFYEKRDQDVSLFWPILFSVLSVLAYAIVNLCILQTVKAADVLYLVGLIAYAFVFRVRNLTVMRYLSLIPTCLSVIYNVWIAAVPFVIVSYAFEFTATVVAIVKYRYFTKEKSEETL